MAILQAETPWQYKKKAKTDLDNLRVASQWSDLKFDDSLDALIVKQSHVKHEKKNQYSTSESDKLFDLNT